MKKTLAILLAVLCLFAFAVPAFAAEISPSGEGSHSITVIDGVDRTPKAIVLKPGESVTVSVDPTLGKFDAWAIYKKDGSAAQVNVDYVITAGGLKEQTLSVDAKTDLIICGNYNGVITNPLTGKASPKTGETAAFALLSVMVAAAGVCFVAKKQLCK